MSAPRPTGQRRRRAPCPTARGPAGCSAHSSEDLPEPFRPMTATTSPRVQLEVDPAHGHDVAVAHDQAAPVQPRPPRSRRGCSPRPRPTAAGTRGCRRSRSSAACRRASRTDSGTGSQPARRPSWTTGGARGEVAERARRRPPGRAVLEHHHRVGVLHDPLEAVLRHHDGDAEIVDEARDGGEHLFGRGGVEGRGGLVEHQHARVRGEHRADRDPLLLAARQRAQRTAAQVGDAQEVERLLDPLAHHGLRHRELLHGVGQLLLHRVA